MQRIYSENPPPFHMYDLAKLDVCSEPRQIHKEYLFVITVFNCFKSLKSDPNLLTLTFLLFASMIALQK